MTRIDIIMATYNGEKYIREQLDSIFANEGCEPVVHVFDDGSLDETMEILAEYRRKYPDHLFVERNENNRGVTYNFLHGIRKVMEHNHEAEYFMCCDQDDVWNNDKIAKTLKRMKQMENRFGADSPLLVFTDAVVTDSNLEQIHPSFYKSQHLEVHKTDLQHLLMENKCIGCTTMFNRCFEPYLWQMPENARFHDWWLALIAAAFGHISYVSRPTMQYRQHAGNVVGGARFGDYVLNRMKGLHNKKLSLLENKKQAEDFLSIFKDNLAPHKRMVLEAFISMFDKKWLERRYFALSQGYVKSGAVRNIGLLLIL